MTLAPRSKRLPRTSRLPRILLVVSLGLLCGLLVSGCGEDGPTLSEVKEFDAYPLYYAGDEIAGNELDDISGEDDWQHNPDQQSVGFTFFYGTCDPTPDGPFDEGGCAPPVQIQVSSICDRHPGLYSGKPDVFDLRGAKASANGGGLEIFTGRTTVVIFGERELMRPTIHQLRRMDQDATPSRLPPPVPGGVQGRLPCQHKPR
jgi:hypothetical protein